MAYAYYDFSDTPVRLSVDDDGLPTRCECYDRATGCFTLRDDLTADIFSGQGARLIDEDEFAKLIATVRERTE